MDTRSTQAVAPKGSLLDSYCAELQRLATTLADLLDLAAGRGAGPAPGDSDALCALAPVLGRLGDHIAEWTRGSEAATERGEDLPAPAPSPGPAPAARSLDAASLEEICAPAVEASVAEALGGSARAVAESGTLEEADAAGRANARAVSEAGADAEESTVPSVGEEPSDAARADDDGRNADAPEPEPVPPERLLPVLLDKLERSPTLQGTACAMPIASLFDLLSGSRTSGCLHVQLPAEVIRIVLDGGYVVATSTSCPPGGQRLGDQLVATGALERSQVDAKAADAKAGGRTLGALLVDEGVVTVEQLKVALKRQVQARFDRVFQAEHAAYAFVPDSGEDLDGRIHARPRELMLESARRADEAARAASRA